MLCVQNLTLLLYFISCWETVRNYQTLFQATLENKESTTMQPKIQKTKNTPIKKREL